MISKLEWAHGNAQQNVEQLQNPTLGVTINKSTTTEPPERTAAKATGGFNAKPIFCKSLSRSKVFAKIIIRYQMPPLARNALKVSTSMDRVYHTHQLQTNRSHSEEETQNTGRQTQLK